MPVDFEKLRKQHGLAPSSEPKAAPVQPGRVNFQSLYDQTNKTYSSKVSQIKQNTPTPQPESPEVAPTPSLTKEDWDRVGGLPKLAPLYAGTGDTIKLMGGALDFASGGKYGGRLKKYGDQISRDFTDEEALSALGDFDAGDLKDPSFWYQKGLRTIPNTVALLPAAIIGAYGGGATGAAIGLGAFGRAVLGTIGGAGLSRTVEGAMEASGTYDEAKMSGMDESSARAAASIVFRNNYKLAGLDAAEFASIFLPTKYLPKPLRGGIASATTKILANVGMEGGEEVYQNKIGADALGKEFDMTSPENRESFVLGGAMGGLFGSGGVVIEKLHEKFVKNLPNEEKSVFEESKNDLILKGVNPKEAEIRALDTVIESSSPEMEGILKKAVAETVEDVQGEVEKMKQETVGKTVSNQDMSGTVQEDGTVKLETPLEIGGKSIDTVPFNSNWTPLEQIAETEAKMTRDKLVEDDLIAAAERKSEKVDAPKVEAEKPVVEAPKQEKPPVIDAPKVETVKPEEIPPVKEEVSSASDYVEKFIKGDAELSGKVAKYKRSSNGDGTFVYTDLGTGSNGKPRYATYWFGDTDLKEGGKEALDEMKGMMVKEIASRDAENAKAAEKKKTVVSKKKPVYIDKTPDKIVSIKETGHQVGDKVMFDGKEHSITSVLKKGVGEAKFELTDDKGKKIWTNKGGLEESKKATASLFAPPVKEKTTTKSTAVTTKKSDTSAETARKNKEDAYSKMKRLMDEGYKEDEEGELWTSDLIDKYSDEAADALGKIGFRLDFNDQFDSYEISLKDKSVSMKEAQEMFVDLAAAWGFKLDTNADGTISMFHGTSEENALSILENGFEPGVFFSPGVDEYYGGVNGASYYGKAVLKADIDPRGLLFRTEGEFYTDDEDAIRNVRAESGVEKKSAIVSESFVDIDTAKQVEKPVAKKTVVSRKVETGMLLEGHAEFMKALREGDQTVEAFKEAFEAVITNAEAIVAELEKKTKDQLKQIIGGIQAYYVDRENKAYAVKSAYSSMLMDFALAKTVTYSMGGSQVNAIREMVDKTTAADIQDFAERVKQARAERAANIEATKKAITNPETKEEFKTFIEIKGKEALTGELLERYDTLVGETTAARIQKEREAKAIVEGKAVETTAEIVETKHTKTGEPLFVVKLADRVEKDVYSSILGSAKRLGGWYSSYRVGGAVPGFQFKTKEGAEQFVAVLGGETVVSERAEERQVEKKENQVDRLLASAETIKERALESLGRERKTNTQRRAGMANSAEEAARLQLQQAESLENIAGAIERGDAKLLGLLSSRTQIEALDTAIRAARTAYGRKHGIQSEKWDEIDMNDAISEITSFPETIYDTQRLIEAGKKTKGFKRVAAAIERESKDGQITPSFTRAEEIVQLAKAADIATWWADQFKRIASLGVKNAAEYRAVLREYAKYKGVKPEADKATELERKLIGAKVGIDFFPTPKSVSEQMVAEAGIEAGMRVLEPSAGNGNIAEAIRNAGVTPDVAEISSELRNILDAKGFNIVGEDFMELEGKYDRIIMNPPFSNNMDIKHVEKAYSMLAEGGRLVAIVGEGAFFRSGKTETAFRDWLDSVDATVEKLPEGTFTDTALMATTGTNARMVVIEKGSGIVLNEVPFFAGREIPATISGGQARTDDLKSHIGRLQARLRGIKGSDNSPARRNLIKAIKQAEDEVMAIRRKGFNAYAPGKEGEVGDKTYFDRDAEGMKGIFFALVGDGTISFQDYKKLEFVIDTFKGNINDVALYFGEAGERAGAGGEYNPYTRVISLYESISGGNAKDIMDTFFHEIMHPGERYLSKETVAKLTTHFKKVQAEAFGRYPGLKEAVKKRDLTYFNKEGHGDLYRFYSISEYIAETGREKTWRTLEEQGRDILDSEKRANKEISAIVQFVAQLWRNFLRFMRKYKNIDEKVYAELMAGRTAKQRELAFWEAEGIDLRDGDREQIIRQVAAMHRGKIPRGKMQWIDAVLKDGMTDSEIAKAVDVLIRSTAKSAAPITPASFNAGASANAISAKRLGVDSATLITPVKRKRYTDLIEQMGGLIAAEKVMQTQLELIPKYYDEMEHQYNSFVTLFKKYPSAREVLTSSDVGGIKDRLEAVMPRSKVDDIFYSSEENIHADDILNDFRDTLSKENPDLFYGQKQAAALGYSKEKSSFKRAMRNLEEGGSAYSEEYMALKTELDAIQAESRGYRAELAEQMAKDTFTFTTKNLREHGLILPRKTVISKKQVENQKKTAFVSGIKKGVKIGVKSGMAYMREIAEDKALSIAEKKKRIVAYAKDSLPIARRGGILSLVANAKTEKDVLKAIGRIDRVAEQTRSKAIIAEIKKVVARVMKTESIDIGYKERISALIDGFNLQNRRRDTIDRLSATKQYIARQQAEGKTADIPKRVQKAIEDLDKTLISSMNEADLMTLLSEIAYLEEIGKNKLKTRRAIYEMKRDRMKEELVESTVRMESSPVLRALPGEAPLTIQEKLKNLVPKTINFLSKVDKYISPVDVIFDILDGSQGFVGANYRLFKRNLDVKFGKFLDRKDVHQSPVKDYADKHKMTVQQYERVGIHAARVQEGGMEKLANNGLTEEYIESIELTDVEMGLYNLMRENLDALRPDIERIMRTVYNKPLEKVDNYFSFMTDFDQVSDVEVLERIVNAQEVGQGKTKTVKKGFTLSRIGAGNQKIKVNAMDIYLKHTENASYLVEMAESIQMLSEIANSDEYLEASGEFGAQLVREWLDTMARKGGLLGEQQIEWLDKMRVNLGAAVLGFKLTAALIQPTALFNGASIIGNYAFKGASNITDQRWRTFLKQFPELRDRMADDPSYLESGFKSLEKVQRYGYMPLQKLDSITASAIVSGAYQKYMDEHGKTVSLDGAPDPDGVNYAETVLRRTQSSAFFKDVPLVLTRGKVGGRSITKALLQFQNFLLNAWSLLRHEGVRRGIGQKKFTDASRIFMWTGVSILVATSIREGVKQALAALTGDDDDDKTFAEKYLKEALGYIPFISQGMSVYSYGSFPVPALSIFGDVDMAAGQIQGKRSDTQARGWIRAGAVFGKLFGIPGTVQTQQILNDLTYK